VLNANYVMEALAKVYDLPHPGPCMHECVLSAHSLAEATGVRAWDIAKRLIDYGMHPPTMYFPLVVKEALMIEPTETESKATLDRFIEAMRRIADEAQTDPGMLHNAPHTAPVGRLDEVRAARQPRLRWSPPQPGRPPREPGG
jgi:glycine dehydrogenase subunit 2